MAQDCSGAEGPVADRETTLLMVEEALEVARTRVETLQALTATFKDGRSEAGLVEGWAKRLEELGDVHAMPAERLQELQRTLEDGLAQLEDQEERVVVPTLVGTLSHRGGAGGEAGVFSSGELLADPARLLGQDHEFGLEWDRRFTNQPKGPRHEALRTSRREGTKKKVAQELGLRHFGDSAWHAKRTPQTSWGVHVFLDRTFASRAGAAPAGGSYLLGRYDVVVARASADLDQNWDFIHGAKPEFWVAHAAALNIGESLRASDFPDFSTGRGQNRLLDEEAYLRAMEHILGNVCRACIALQVKHVVFFPFGMGAFMRQLGQLDPTFTSAEELQRLRRRVAGSFMRVLARATPPSTRVHLCLGFSTEEAQCNADAFLRALLGHSAGAGDGRHVEALARRVTIYPEGDSLHLAHELASESQDVLLVNGANRKLLGNHWFAAHALRAIDENLHRRSWRMAATSYLLNGFGDRKRRGRSPQDLEKNAKWLRGEVHLIEDMGEQR